MNDIRRPLTLGVLALTLALVYGLWYSYGVIMVALLREFGWSRSVLAGAFSLFTLTHGAAGPAIGWLCGRFQPPQVVAVGSVILGTTLWFDSFITQPWQLYLSFGVFTAVAAAASGWVPAVVQTQRRFSDRLGLALGIVSSGVGLGMLLVVPICQLLIDAYGWRWALRVLGVACVAWTLPASIYLLRTAGVSTRVSAAPSNGSPLQKASSQREKATDMTLAQAARTTPFWLIMAAFIFGNVCAQMLHVHQVAYLVDHGMAAIVAASVVSVVGASSIVAKIVGGWISDLIGREIVYVACIVIMIAAVGMLVVVGMSPTRLGAYAYGVLLGVGYSVTASITPAMASDRFSGRHFGAIVGMGLFGSAIGSALGPWLAGALFDMTGSYAVAFMIAAACGVLAGASGWVLRRQRLQSLLPHGSRAI